MVGYGYGTLVPSRKQVKLGIVRGAELPDPAGFMQGRGKVHRHVALWTPADLARPGLKSLLEDAVRAWRKRNVVTK